MRNAPLTADAPQSNKPRRRRLAVPLGFVMLALIPLAAGLGWAARVARDERRATQAMENWGSDAITYESKSYEDPLEANFFHDFTRLGLAPPPIRRPSWLARRLGTELFDRIAEVDLAAPIDCGFGGDAGFMELESGELATLKPLGKLHRVVMKRYNVGRDAICAAAEIQGLRTLELNNCLISAEGFASIRKCRSLERLVLRNVPLGSPQLDWSACAHIKDLRLQSAFSFDLSLISLDFLAGLTRLEALSLSGVDLGALDLAPISKLKSLRVLELSPPWLRGGSLARLVGLNKLESLNLSSFYVAIPAEEFALLARLPNLRELNVGLTSFDRDSLEALRARGCLESLELSESGVTPDAIAEIGLPDLLQRFYFNNVEPKPVFDPQDDLMMDSVARLSHLRMLSLDRKSITDSGASRLNGLSKLEAISLMGTPIRDLAGLKPDTLGNLEFVDVSWSGLTSAGLATLCRLPKLKRLRLGNTAIASLAGVDFAKAANLEEIDLGGTDIGDADLQTLAKAPRLRVLNLARTAITDLGFLQARFPKSLESINISYTAATTKSVRFAIERYPVLRQLVVPNGHEADEYGLDADREILSKAK